MRRVAPHLVGRHPVGSLSNRPDDTMRRTFTPLILALATTSACSGSDPIAPPDPTEIQYDASLGIDFGRMTETASGLWYEDLQVGTGEQPVAGDSVFILYTGWLPNGTSFDSVTDPDDALGFVFLVERLIPGFEEGIATMREGGIRKLVIPPDLGYGSAGRGPIPSNSVLIFQVNLLDARRAGS